MNLSSYQQRALETDVTIKDDKSVCLPLLGLFGEAGSLLSALKKHLREKENFKTYRNVVEEELGDCLWYLANTCSRLNIDLDDLALEIANITMSTFPNLEARAPNMDQLQALATATLIFRKPTFEADLFQLGSAAGRLLELSQTPESPDLRDALREMLLVIGQASAHADVSLASAAKRNLDKNKSRWPGETRSHVALFDEQYPEEEHLPRDFKISFREYSRSGRTFVIQSCNSINIGDRLTDNKIDPDDYRFHDVFHLAYAVHLGWSPVLRTLFKVKRKSNPTIDEGQDGARAIIIEEGIR
ncbi:MAG: pyrophosphatase [Pseudomonadota bacterium]